MENRDKFAFLQAQLRLFSFQTLYPDTRNPRRNEDALALESLKSSLLISLAYMRTNSRFEDSVQRVLIALVESGLDHLCLQNT